jgi:hypothetical protein
LIIPANSILLLGPSRKSKFTQPLFLARQVFFVPKGLATCSRENVGSCAHEAAHTVNNSVRYNLVPLHAQPSTSSRRVILSSVCRTVPFLCYSSIFQHPRPLNILSCLSLPHEPPLISHLILGNSLSRILCKSAERRRLEVQSEAFSKKRMRSVSFASIVLRSISQFGPPVLPWHDRLWGLEIWNLHSILVLPCPIMRFVDRIAVESRTAALLTFSNSELKQIRRN